MRPQHSQLHRQGATPTVTPSPTRPGTSAPTSPSDDVPGPLPWGARTLTGIVKRSGGCTVLVVGKRRWTLTGKAAATLVPGAKVTVRGNLTTRQAGCDNRDLAQTIAITRVNPA